MIRIPLRPLAKVLMAREDGRDPDLVEAHETVRRQSAVILSAKDQSRRRILLLLISIMIAFSAIGIKMFSLASLSVASPGHAQKISDSANSRQKITDRNGGVLATNIKTFSLYVHPQELIDGERAAKDLQLIFPEQSSEKLLKLFSGSRKFAWIKKSISPEQMQMVKNLGEPGLKFGSREIRLYPNGRFAAHILGGTTFGDQGVNEAETNIVGEAGIERTFDNYLSKSENKALALSIDIPVQSIIEKVLENGIHVMNAKGGSAILMDANNGQVLALASLPDFDPNFRPRAPIKGDPSDSPLFNRAAQGLYELGSTLKIFAAAQALDQNLASVDTIINIKGPLSLGRFRVTDHHYLGKELSMSDVIVKSSNIGTARIAGMIGGSQQKNFFKKFGLLDVTGVELPEASRAIPQFPKRWSKVSSATISYGHGISITPLHLASAYCAIVNGGRRVIPTLIKSNEGRASSSIISHETSLELQKILKDVVKKGTAKSANLIDYEIGGKTGTAEKVNFDKPGYIKDKVITTFVAAFPISQPEYVLVVTLDEPEDWSTDKPERTAGWTAVPVATEIVRRIAPVLGIKPGYMPTDKPLVSASANFPLEEE
ncbi:MAG: penicillin-binding protein 2 [Pseudomonadota bacterium]|nr:penicillin-binding protein 2 [Pseudomonadota bacterium]